MARLMTVGFESGKIDELNGAYSIANTPTVSSTYRRTGTYSINFGKTTYFSHVFAYSVSELYFRIALYIRDPGQTHDPFEMVEFVGEDGTVQLTLAYSQYDFCLDWYRGKLWNTGYTAITGTKLDSGNIIIRVDEWTILEGHIVIDNSSGECTLKINGTTDATFTGDTQADATDNTVRSIWFRGGFGVGTFGYVDDIAVNDTSGSYQNSWCGLGGIFYLEPVADGDQNDWTPSSGTVNYAMVDDIPPDNATTFNQGELSGELELYEVDDCPQYVNTVNLLEVVYRAALATSGYNELTDIVKTAGTVYQGSETTIITITPTFAYYKGTAHYINPNTGTAWGTAEVSAMQAGVEITV